MQQAEFLTKSPIQQGIPITEQFIHRWGNSTSELILDTSCKFFSCPEIAGLIGYREINQCAVALGEPICSEENKPVLATAFQNFCVDKQLNYIYFIVSGPFAKWAIENICNIMIDVGEEIIFDPFTDSMRGHKGFKMRNRTQHAKALGLKVKEYLLYDVNVEKSILNVGQEWVQTRRGPQIYLGKLDFFEKRADRRWFYLQDENEKIIGMALLTKLEAYRGWLLKFLITVPNVPRGASELLMISILQTLRSEDCHYLTYGMIAADEMTEITGLNKTTTWIAKKGFNIAKWFFHLDQRKIYWQKFHPKIEKAYLLFGNPSIGTKELRALVGTMKMNF